MIGPSRAVLGNGAVAELALPRQPSDADDWLLTVSEIAQFKLDADWVCSRPATRCGDKSGAEALSGLPRAFFYAGPAGDALGGGDQCGDAAHDGDVRPAADGPSAGVPRRCGAPCWLTWPTLPPRRTPIRRSGPLRNGRRRAVK
jgi:hypothetical protein